MIAPTTLSQADLWGLVLAGGEGKRLEGYVRQLHGKSLPKQYVNFIGTRSMLQHTWDRAERLIPRQKILTIVTEHHLLSPEVCRQLAYRASGTVIVQPANKDTGLGVLLPLTYLHRRCPGATVAVFPSDHFILEEDRFIDHVRLAARAVYHNPSQIVLLAVEAQRAEPDYGYVVFADESGQIDLYGCCEVAHFVEKPGLADARLLVAGGALWNTMIMVFRVETLLHHIQTFFPDVARQFRSFAETIGTAAEKDKIKQIYSNLSPVNFSKDILERIAVHAPRAVTGLPVLQVTWSDWGTSDRLSKTLRQLGAESFATPEPVVSDRRAVRVAAEKNSAAISKIH
ncbi:MAG TPA: sugar phosphate nucleotidyltransferase [Candidatus Binatia bacterium]|nr:sugar phosphate nucleotidyltransferase [Candidatus Binatia bacterium]